MMGLTIVLVAAAASPALPQSVPPEDLLKRLHGCAALRADGERLTCYDREAAALDRAAADGSVTLVTDAQVEKANRAGFGYSNPKIAQSVHLKPASEIKEVNSLVRSVSGFTYGRYNIGLADGSVWQNVDLLSTSPRTGEKVQISKTPFGSYIMKIPYSESVHAKRIR